MMCRRCRLGRVASLCFGAILVLATGGVDALIHGDRVVHSAPSGPAARSIRAAPFAWPAAQGFRVTTKF